MGERERLICRAEFIMIEIVKRNQTEPPLCTEHTSNFTIWMHKLHTRQTEIIWLWPQQCRRTDGIGRLSRRIRLASWCVQLLLRIYASTFYLLPITLPYDIFNSHPTRIMHFLFMRSFAVVNAISWTVENDRHSCYQLHHHSSPIWWSNKCNSCAQIHQ